MKKKNLFYLIFLLLIPIVYAKDIFSSILDPIGIVDFAGTYTKYWAVFDFTIYLILFLSVARYAFRKWYDQSKPAAKSLSAAVGIALAISLTIWSSKNGFRLADIGPFAAILLLIIIVMLIYQLLKSFGMKLPYSAAWTFLLFYVILTAIFPKLYEWMVDSASILGGIVNLLFFISFIFVILSLIQMFKRERTEDDLGGPERETERETERARERTIGTRERELERLQRIRSDLSDYENQLVDTLDDTSKDELGRLKKLGELIAGLGAIQEQLERREGVKTKND